MYAVLFSWSAECGLPAASPTFSPTKRDLSPTAAQEFRQFFEHEGIKKVMSGYDIVAMVDTHSVPSVMLPTSKTDVTKKVDLYRKGKVNKLRSLNSYILPLFTLSLFLVLPTNLLRIVKP
jgi:hypothetical protein